MVVQLTSAATMRLLEFHNQGRPSLDPTLKQPRSFLKDMETHLIPRGNPPGEEAQETSKALKAGLGVLRGTGPRVRPAGKSIHASLAALTNTHPVGHDG